MSKIGCQLCLANFGKMCDLKAHMRGKKHKQQMAVVFPKDKCKQWGVFSHIVVMKHLVKCGRQRPILGLSLVTVCLTTKSNTKVFYLCHVCEAKCSQQEIMVHLSSAAHYVHYYNCIHPDSLSFSWIPRMNMATILRPLAFQEMLKKGSGTLQVLDLPEDLFAALETLPYTKVMSTLRENDKLSQQLRVSWPKTTTMQSYLTDSGRKHTLLGVQHLVECICEGQTEKRFYLCMICHLGLRRNKIINHVISFDHIHRYISAWHPSTLLSKDCYIKYDRDFSFMMYNYAKQAAEQHGMPNNEMKKVTLQPVLFNALEATCYSVALSKLEALRKECNESSLNTAIQPRAKLAGSILNKLKMKKRNMHLSPELRAGHKLFLTERPKETEEERDSEVDPVTNEPTVKVKEEAGSECQYSESGECFSAAVTCEAPPAAKQEKEPDGAKAAVRLCAEPHTDEGLQIKEPAKEKVSFETSPEETVKEKVILKEVSLKFESKSPGRESPDTPPKPESPGGGKEVGSETQRHNVREGKEDKKAEKRQTSESGGKEEGSKLRRLNSGDKMQPLTEAQNVSYQLAGIGGDRTKVTARPNSASNTLGAYVKLKARAPVVGLGALVECHCDRYAPLYLCKSCCLKIPEKNIVPHVIGCGHQMLYLRLEKPRKKKWRRSVGNAAAMHEREWGSGEAEIVELEQEDYDQIAEQSFYYGITKVRDLFGQQDSCRSLKSPLTGVGRSPDIQVVDTNPSRQCKEQLPSTAVVTSSSSAPASYPQGPSQTIKFPSETTGDINVDVAANCGTHNTTTKLTDCIDIGVGACRDVKNSSNKPITKSHAITSQTGASSKSLETNAKAGTPFNASTERIKSAATSKPVPSQPSTVRVVAASSQSRATISKSPVISSSTLLNSSLTATVSKFTPAPISVEAIGLGTSFKNVTAVNIAEANYSPTSSLASKTAALVNTEITSQTTATNMVCGKRYISKNAEGSAKTQCSKTSDNAAVAQSCSAPVFPSLPATMNSTPALMVAPMEPIKSQCVVGLGHLVAVMCKKRRQYYCLLCSVRLKNSVHMTSYSHRCNYVRYKFPGWTASPSEMDTKLLKMVTQFCIIEKDAGINTKKVEVSCDEYNELAALPVEEALAKLKATIMQQNPSSTTDPEAEGIKGPSSGSHGASQPADGLAGNCQPEQESQSCYAHKLGVSIQGQKSPQETKEKLALTSTMEGNKNVSIKQEIFYPEVDDQTVTQSVTAVPTCNAGLAVSCQPDEESQSCHAHKLGVSIQGQKSPQEMKKKLALTSTMEGNINVPIKQEIFYPEVDDQTVTQSVTPVPTCNVKKEVDVQAGQNNFELTDAPAPSTDEKTNSPPIAACSESPDASPKTPNALEEIPKHIDVAQETMACPSTEPDGSSSVVPREHEEPILTEPILTEPILTEPILTEPILTEPIQRSVNVLKHSGHNLGPQVMQMVERIVAPSNLLKYLSVMGLDKEPIIGLSFVWECRGIRESTFYLCESCKMTLSISHICDHIVSTQHQLSYMLKHYPHFLAWWEENLPQECKVKLLKDVAKMLSDREMHDKMDAQVILMGNHWCERLQAAPFSKALHLLQCLMKKKDLSGLYGTTTASQQLVVESDRNGDPISFDIPSQPSTETQSEPQDKASSEQKGPVVGLSAVIQCCCDNQTPFYLCVACGNSLSCDLVSIHVQRYRHTMQYLSTRYPWYFEGVDFGRETASLSAKLMEIAREVEEQNHNEPGTIQFEIILTLDKKLGRYYSHSALPEAQRRSSQVEYVHTMIRLKVQLSLEDFNMIQMMTFEKALCRLQAIYKSQNQSELVTCITDKRHQEVGQVVKDNLEDLSVEEDLDRFKGSSPFARSETLSASNYSDVSQRSAESTCEMISGNHFAGPRRIAQAQETLPHTQLNLCLKQLEASSKSLLPLASPSASEGEAIKRTKRDSNDQTKSNPVPRRRWDSKLTPAPKSHTPVKRRKLANKDPSVNSNSQNEPLAAKSNCVLPTDNYSSWDCAGTGNPTDYQLLGKNLHLSSPPKISSVYRREPQPLQNTTAHSYIGYPATKQFEPGSPNANIPNPSQLIHPKNDKDTARYSCLPTMSPDLLTSESASLNPSNQQFPVGYSKSGHSENNHTQNVPPIVPASISNPQSSESYIAGQYPWNTSVYQPPHTFHIPNPDVTYGSSVPAFNSPPVYPLNAHHSVAFPGGIQKRQVFPPQVPEQVPGCTTSQTIPWILWEKSNRLSSYSLPNTDSPPCVSGDTSYGICSFGYPDNFNSLQCSGPNTYSNNVVSNQSVNQKILPNPLVGPVSLLPASYNFMPTVSMTTLSTAEGATTAPVQHAQADAMHRLSFGTPYFTPGFREASKN